MSREKVGQRELDLRLEEQGLPLLLSKTQTAKALDVSRTHLDTIISKGRLKVQDGKISRWVIAGYLCG